MPLRAAQPQAGSVDLSFDAGELGKSRAFDNVGGITVVEDMTPLADGRIYIGGHLGSVQGVPRDAIARLLPNGLVDATFQEHAAEFSLGGDTHRLFLQNDGKMLAGYNCLRRFHPDGTGDSWLTNCPNVIAVLPDGRLLAISNEFPSRPFRLLSDGTRDPSFSTPVNLGGDGFPALIESDGRIVLPAWFETDLAYRLVRLLPDGALDPSFTAVTFKPGSPEALARQPDGRYLLAGVFHKINGQQVGMIVRLNTDGTFDPSLAIAADVFLQEDGDYIHDLAVQPDGKILVGGQFGNPRSTSQGGLLRLNRDGSVDSSFDIGAGAQRRNEAGELIQGAFVKRIVLQPDGRILVSGEFTEFGGVPRPYLVRLHGDSPAPAGKLVAWGANEFGQTNVPPGDNFVAIAAGEFHALALRSDGSLIGWGLNYGHQDLESASIFYGQAIAPTGYDFKAIAAGVFHSLALRTNGSLVGWGANEIFGNDPNPTGQAIVPAGNDFVAIAAGNFHSLALKSDGSLVAWGDNSEGQANVPAGNDFTAIAAGDFHNLALKSDGSIVAWGSNSHGQTNSPPGTNFVTIASSWKHNLALKSDGSMVGWGQNGAGQATPRPGANFVAVAAGWGQSLALKSDGSMVGWGANYDDFGTFYGQAVPRSGTNFIAISASDRFSVAIQMQPPVLIAAPAGKLIAWGANEFGQTNVPPGDDFVAIAARQNYHGLALQSDGSLAGWGWNYGEPDFGAANVFYGQAIVPTGNDFKAIAVGAFHSLALRTNGSLVCWGANESGQTNVPAGNDFVAIAAGDWHNLALRSDGSLVGWGGRNFEINGIFLEVDVGQTNVPSGNDFVAIASGDFHGLALKSDGSLVAWGLNDRGQLNVPSGNDFVAIASGWAQNLALKSDGSMVGWGGNAWGQATPRAGTNFVAVAGGERHSLALKSNGSLVAWGNNSFGQTNMPAGTNFIAISGGWRHSVAIQMQPPLLTIAQIGNDVVLSWSTNHTGYTLDGRTDVSPLSNWTPVPGTPTILDNRHTVTNSAASGNQFFRLRR